MFKRNVIGYSQLSLRTDDIEKLRSLKELGVIKSMSSYVHFLLIKELQELKKRKIVKKRVNIEDKTIKLADNYDYNLEQYINSYNDYMLQQGYKPIMTDDEEIMEWIR